MIQRVALILIGVLISTVWAHPAVPPSGQTGADRQSATNVVGGTAKEKRPSFAPLAPVYAKALEGDVREALRILQAVPVDTLESTEQKAREGFLKTFVEKKLPPIEVRDPFVAEVVGIYRDYWMRVLLHELNTDEGKAYLFEHLAACLGRAGCGGKFGSFEKLSDKLGQILQQKGFYSIRGVTRPYYELMLWGRETARAFKVELPETTIKVKVVFMHDFATLGWSAFATCGKAYSGGWARKDSLYCVAQAYDTNSTSFKANYLSHESQHFADYKRFPKLEQTELEYRAKLVELILAKEAARVVLTGFALQTGRSRSAPHNYANLMVFTDISRSLLGGDLPEFDPGRWKGISDQDISRAAKVLLAHNTKNLEARGERKVTRIFE